MVPSVLIAADESAPASTLAQSTDAPTCIRLDLSTVVPSPNWPFWFFPDEYKPYGGGGGGGIICTAVNDPFILTPEIVSAILFF
jgi:hypothetical protein